jgi:PleD family two-component response regulator
LQPAGYSLYPVSTGEEALQRFKLARPEIILLDLFLPDMDGKEVLRRLRAWTSTPIVVMSVRNQESEKIACLDAGADDYLTKPFTMGSYWPGFELFYGERSALHKVKCLSRATSESISTDEKSSSSSNRLNCQRRSTIS